MKNKSTPRSTVKRLPERSRYDTETIYNILDEGLLCHVGIVENGSPVVIPMNYARLGNQIILHGAPGSRLLKTIKKGNDVCITVTLLDGLVLARSAMHHSMNYRSVVIFGRGTLITNLAEKNTALKALVESLIPGRWENSRQPSERELKQTAVISVNINEASAKIRFGHPKDDEKDYLLDYWAGQLPLKSVPQKPIADIRLAAGIKIPEYIKNYKRKNKQEV
jgi:uncharacterized protein